MRVPSIELLRALRCASLPHTSHSAVHPSTTWKTLSRPEATIVSCSPLASTRYLSTTRRHCSPPPPPPPRSTSKSSPPATHDRGPKSSEDTQTDFGAMDIYANASTPATSIDACITDGFHLNNGIQTSGGSGVLLFGGEAFLWRPWAASTPGGAGADPKIGDLLSKVGVLEFPPAAWGLLALLYPKPDLLIVGTGSKLWVLGKETRARLSELGVRVDVMDTGNAAAAYNLLATERGVDGVGAALLPVGWKGR